jgi:hypothetical protein
MSCPTMRVLEWKEATVPLWTPPGVDLGENAPPDADSRMMHFGGGVGSQGEVLPITYRRLHKYAHDNFVITATTPDGPARLLKAARDMFCLAFYSYELVACSASWSIFGVEAALKLRLGVERAVPLVQLVAKAREQGIVSDYAADILDAGRQIRNNFVHQGIQPAWTFGMASRAIGASFKMVAELYPSE